VFLAQHCAKYDAPGSELWIIAFKIFANCLSYMNSCVNPILYAFLSEPFRKNFRRLLFCRLCGTLFQSGGCGTTDTAVEMPALGRASRYAAGAGASVDGNTRHHHHHHYQQQQQQLQPVSAAPAVKYQHDDVAIDVEHNAAA